MKTWLLLPTALTTFALTQTHALANEPTTFAPTLQTNDSWFKEGQSVLSAAMQTAPINTPARNIILFVGDGMSVGTMTAARIYAGQQAGDSGEEFRLEMEALPHVAMSKTYNTDMQTPDSAGTATAMVTGVKTKAGTLGVNDNVQRGFCSTIKGNEAKTIFQIAAEKGKALGVVSTARLTHATPAATYAYSADRNWENNTTLTNISVEQGCRDIAQQFVDYDYGFGGFQVALGGGLREFTLVSDGGKRTDHDLTTLWQQRYPDGAFVSDHAALMDIDVSETERLFGLFGLSHMDYELDRDDSQPSLAQMTETAISMLAKNDDGYMLMIESGRIDHAHHAGNAKRALEDTLAFDAAIAKALAMTDPNETLIIVTADHAHTLVMNGYAPRGNDILGLAMNADGPVKADDGKAYTTLTYGNGPGAISGERAEPTAEAVVGDDYLQQALIPLSSETHSQEDVAILATGPKAWLFQGVVEQNYIFHVMNEAFK
uniref:alkaline phosphatase n=1 Tax=Thaumasiovibrio occultus TaxID=1891184 RepID=UPI000B358B7A|nr:alkaline phosphatase [Thaumasiovibrio occultus]